MENINELPALEEVKRKSKSLATLDAILSPEYEYRYFSYQSKWGEGEELASMRDGEGTEYFLVFDKCGAVGKVCHKDNCLNDHSVQLEKVPSQFLSFKEETAFDLEYATFYFWNEQEKKVWKSTNTDFGHYSPLAFLVHGPEFYHEWAMEYYQHHIELSDVRRIFEHQNLSNDLVARLSQGSIEIDDLQDDFEEIGYS